MTSYSSQHGAGLANTYAAIAERKSFQSNGALSGSRAWNGEYRVFSYAAVIAIFDPNTETWKRSTRKWSQTTTRHQSVVFSALLKADAPVETVYDF